MSTTANSHSPAPLSTERATSKPLVQFGPRRCIASVLLPLLVFAVVLQTIGWSSRIQVIPDRNSSAPDRILSAFDPIANEKVLKQRLNFSCKPHVPTISELRTHPYRYKWNLSRFAAYHNIYRHLNEIWKERTEESVKLDVLDASGSVFLEPFKEILNITKTKYPEIDLHRTPYESDSFDVITADQVLEHTIFPHQVVLEMHRILKEGGIAILTTVAYNPLHEGREFHDVWRFMLDGLKVLSLPFKGGIQICGSWGHKDAIAARVEGMGESREQRLFEDGFERMASTNDLVNPFLVWIVMEK